MTELLFREDPYLKSARATVQSVTAEGGLVLDRSLFYPTGGGQPGDSGRLAWDDGMIDIATAIKGEADELILVPAAPSPIPGPGAEVTQLLNWDRRYRHMKIHTALHLLSVTIPLPVTGGAISAERGRLDFNMPEALENRDEIEADLNRMIAADLPVGEEWISDAELEANPDMVKTLRVRPPRGQGRVRLVRIGLGSETVDLQPCGGTHVTTTTEIGPVRLGKIEKKGRENRRVTLLLGDGPST